MFHKGGDGKPRGFGFGGFALGGRKPESSGGGGGGGHGGGSRGGAAIPPPSAALMAKRGYTAMTTISQNAMAATYGLPRKRPKNEEEYFDDDEEETVAPANNDDLEYIPAPGSPSLETARGGRPNAGSDSSEEDDPLDAFMAGIEKQVQKEKEKLETVVDLVVEEKIKGVRNDIDEEDDEESYYRYMEENPTAGLPLDDIDGDLEYDEDGNPIAPVKSKYIDPLPPIDHTEITYLDYEKNFYEEHADIAALGPLEVLGLRQKLGIKVSGALPPKPVTSFAHFGFDEELLKAIRKSEYTQPTPIQSQGIPIALSGRDIIGIAKTGSGKTAAFLWPMMIHIMDQRELRPDDGPVGLILAPTRELSQQIFTEAKKFGKVYNIHVVCCYGGGSKWEQSKALQEGAEIVVATPGRMIDLVKIKATNLQRVTFLVLDEADRMFDMGFEPQVRSICDHVRPDRQTLMFSATFKRRVEKLARDILNDPIRVVQGDVGEANEDVVQIVSMFPSGLSKWQWLMGKLVEFTSVGSVLIFVTKKDNSEELAANLRTRDFQVGLLHGDLDQTERNKVITSFKKQEMPILVATDVAARGLDIPHIRTVVNYDVARDIDTHTHRVGRTGRAGEKGVAHTLVTLDKDKEFAGHLVRNLEGANQQVPKELMDLAMQSGWFRKSRFKGGKGKRLPVGGKGLGFRERPGFGSSSSGDGPSSIMGRIGGNVGYDGSALSAVGAVSTVTPPAPRTGPQSDRLSAMKASYQAQYKNQFRAASGENSMSTSSVLYSNFVAPPAGLSLPPPPPPPPPPPASHATAVTASALRGAPMLDSSSSSPSSQRQQQFQQFQAPLPPKPAPPSQPSVETLSSQESRAARKRSRWDN